MKADKYIIHGTYNIEAVLGPNSATAIQKGRVCVTLPSLDMTIYCYTPTAAVSVIIRRIFSSSIGNCHGKKNVQLVKETKSL
jgi:hypothetical protein